MFAFLFAFLLFGELLGACPRNWNSTVDGKNCFHTYAVRENYQGAIQYCRKRDADLISIHNGFENNHIYTVAAEFRAQCDYWIGLNDFNEDGVFAWTDGTPNTYQHFEKGYPSEKGGTAVYMTVSEDSAFWVNTDDTNDKMCFICQKASTEETTKITHPSTPNVTPPPVPGVGTPSSGPIAEFTTKGHICPGACPPIATASHSSGTPLNTPLPVTDAPRTSGSLPPITYEPTEPTEAPILDCEDLLKSGNNVSKAYMVQDQIVFCDMETEGGGWTYLYRRMDDSVDFDDLQLNDYNSTLLGDPDKTHWQPLWFMSQLTTQKVYELLIEVKGNRYQSSKQYYAYDKYAFFRVYGNLTINVLHHAEDGGNMTTQTFNLETESQWRSFKIVNRGFYKLGGWWVSEDVDPTVQQPMYPCGTYNGYQNFGFYVCTGPDATSCQIQYPKLFSMKIRKSRDVQKVARC